MSARRRAPKHQSLAQVARRLRPNAKNPAGRLRDPVAALLAALARDGGPGREPVGAARPGGA